MKRHIVIAGGSGFLGNAMTQPLIERGYDVVVLSRSQNTVPPGATGVYWDGRTLDEWVHSLDGAHAVINLAGKNVNCRYSKDNLEEINSSRTDSVHVIGQAISNCTSPPTLWVQASTLAIYGDAGERICDENAPIGEGIPASTAVRWEEAFNATSTPNTRRVVLRISFALGRGYGALEQLTRVTRWFLGGPIGTGEQYISWIHIRDLIDMFMWAIETDTVEGIYNATSPGPVTNHEFMTRLRKVLRRPWAPRTPAWMVEFGCFVLRSESVLALTGRRGVPVRLQEEGFSFRYPELETALEDLFLGQ